MNIYLLFGLFAVVAAAPEPNSWPYRDSLHPYYYGYPGQTPYVYRASLEDDEEPVERSRQDSGVSVASLVQNAALKQQEAIDNYGSETPTTVVETGSAAPVPQAGLGESSSAAAAPSKVAAPSSSSSSQQAAPLNVVKPGVVNPPAFPPAKRPPAPTQKPKPAKEEEDEDDDDDDDEESAEDDESPEDDEEEEVEEERRRNEPLNIPAPSAAPVENGTSLESSEVPVSNVNASAPAQSTGEEDEINEAIPVAELQVGPDQEDDMSDEASLEGVEAFVPGYVTDQGEVLVPVDTVTGDQPISIVPDPYSPPSRGVPLNYFGYNAAGMRPSPGRHSLYRQDDLELEGFEAPEDEESQEDEDADEDEEDEKEEKEEKVAVAAKPEPKRKPPLGLIPASSPTNEDDELESALRYRAENFPPSRSPSLYPVTFKINGGYLTGPFDRPVESSEVYQFVDPTLLYRRRPTVQQSVAPGNVFYGASAERRRPSGSIPVQLSVAIPSELVNQQLRRTSGQQMSQRPVYGPNFHPYYSHPYSVPQQYVPRPATLHNPGEKLKIKSSYELLVEPHTGDMVRVRNKKRPNKKRVSANKKTGQQVVKRRPVTVIARPAVTPYRPSGPAPAGSGQPSVLYRPVYNVEPLQRVPARIPQGVGYRQPPYLNNAYNEFIKGLASGYYGNRRPVLNRPTPVIHQDEPVSSEEPAIRTPKTRREAKKVKKNKKVTDPLQILKKINRKS